MADTARAERDKGFMQAALMLAERGLGTTAPNPSVGAIVIDEDTGEVIARGTTAPGGRPHAETVALASAGERARGKTMYVTLEPCSHHGATPPCSGAIIAAGIRRVVAAIEDPDPRVAGRGLAQLRTAGIEVRSRVLGAEADWVTKGHILRVTERRPFIQAKLALAADGSVPRGAAGQPAWVTGPEARAQGHLLRATSDAILIGRHTVEDDDPMLTCRLPGLANRSPLRVILAKDLDITPAAKVIETAREVPVLVFCKSGAEQARREKLEAAGCRVAGVRTVDDALWLPAVAEELAARGVTRLLVEGGVKIWSAFARAGFVDETILFLAQASERSDIPAETLMARYLPRLDMVLSARRAVGRDAMLVFRRAP